MTWGPETVLAIVLGVATGVVANTLCWHFSRHIFPWFSDFSYKGVKLAGTWSVQQPPAAADGQPLTESWELSVVLKQTAYSLHGTATATRKLAERPAEVISYNVKGKVRDRFVFIEFENDNRNRIGYSSFLLEVKGANPLMYGYRSFYGHKACRVRSISCIWQRIR